MRLSWNEVRARPAAFAEDWKDAAYEKGETQNFYNAFFDVFEVRRRNVARYEAHGQPLRSHPMPPDLRHAHRALDRAVDRFYRRTGFASERLRVEHLFTQNEKMRAPLEAGMKGRTERRTKRKSACAR